MLTWIRLGPILALPVLLLNAIGFLPTTFYDGRYFGGGPIREWTLNTFLIPVLGYVQAEQIVDWFQAASIFQECLLFGIMMINLDALLLPVLYGFGKGTMRVFNWISVRDLELKRKAAR